MLLIPCSPKGIGRLMAQCNINRRQHWPAEQTQHVKRLPAAHLAPPGRHRGPHCSTGGGHSHRQLNYRITRRLAPLLRAAGCTACARGCRFERPSVLQTPHLNFGPNFNSIPHLHPLPKLPHIPASLQLPPPLGSPRYLVDRPSHFDLSLTVVWQRHSYHFGPPPNKYQRCLHPAHFYPEIQWKSSCAIYPPI